MRHCTVVMALLWTLLQSLPAQTVRVATWDLEGVEATSPDASPSAPEVKRLWQIAANLRSRDADILVLHGIPDAQTARRLAGFLKPSNYIVALHCAFKKSGANNLALGPPLAILAKKQPFVARATEWRATGQLDAPGGFAFAGFNSGPGTICLYVAHLPIDEPVAWPRGDNPLPTRKREQAAQYLVQHANWVVSTRTNQVATFLIAGNFLGDPRGGRAGSALRFLQQAGFKGTLPNLPINERAGQPGDEMRAPPILSTFLIRNADFVSTPQVLTRTAFTPAMVTYELALAGPVPAPVPVASPVPATRAWWEQDLVRLWAGASAGLIVLIGFSAWLIRRATPSAGVFGKRTYPSSLNDHTRWAGGAEHSAFGDRPGQGPSNSAAAADAAQAAVWQERAAQAEKRANQAVAVMGGGLMPQLSRLMRERLFSWLTSQRSQLLISHEIGTQRVLELEQRLQKLHEQFQDSLQTREERITELEQEILAKERVIRELLRAQVRVANGTPNRS